MLFIKISISKSSSCNLLLSYRRIHPTPLNPSWASDFLWPIECSEHDNMPFLGLSLKSLAGLSEKLQRDRDRETKRNLSSTATETSEMWLNFSWIPGEPHSQQHLDQRQAVSAEPAQVAELWANTVTYCFCFKPVSWRWSVIQSEIIVIILLTR